MIFKTNLRLGNLHCVTPTDRSGEDEPYLWVFFITVDGSNIRQRTNDPTHLSANVTVVSGPGRPGNLSEARVSSGGNIHIPPAVGETSSFLRPIVLTFDRGGTTFRVFVPGRVGIFCFAIEEDSTPRLVMEGAFKKVKSFIETELNDFLNGLDLQGMAGVALASIDPVRAFQTLFTQRLTQFIGDIRRRAINLVTGFVLYEAASAYETDPFGTLDDLFDPDEPIGFARFQFNEQEIINDNFEERFQADLRQPHDNLGGAWYVVHGSLEASTSFTAADVKSQSLPEVSQPIGTPEEYVFQRDHIPACVYAGSTVQISRIGHAERYQISVEYPFLTYQYFIDGQPLTPIGGTIVMPKEVIFPEFDEDSLMPGRPFIKYRKETRQVKVQFGFARLQNDPQIEQLFLSNDPADGIYDLLLQIEAVLPNGRTMPVGSEPIIFDGQSIELPPDFAKNVRDCLENFVGTRWSKSKRLNPKDLWGPAARRQRYEQITNELDTLATVGAFEKAEVEAIKDNLAAALKIKRH